MAQQFNAVWQLKPAENSAHNSRWTKLQVNRRLHVAFHSGAGAEINMGNIGK